MGVRSEPPTWTADTFFRNCKGTDCCRDILGVTSGELRGGSEMAGVITGTSVDERTIVALESIYEVVPEAWGSTVVRDGDEGSLLDASECPVVVEPLRTRRV